MAHQKNKLKKIIGAFSIGLISTGTVVPVLACGDDTNTVVQVPASLELELDKITLHEKTGFSSLPTEPEHTHWEFRLGKEGEFTPKQPEKVAVGDVEAIKLVADEGYELDGQARRDVIIVMGDVDTTDAQATLQTLQIDTLDDKLDLIDAPEHSHWEYQVNGGAYVTTAPVPNLNLIAGDIVGIKLVVDPNYEPTNGEEVLRPRIEVKGGLDTAGLQEDLTNQEITVDDDSVQLPLPPTYDADHPDDAKAWWEYQAQDETTWTRTEPLLDLTKYTLSTGDEVRVRLAVAEKYQITSNDPIQKTFVVKTPTDTKGIQTNLDKVPVIQPATKSVTLPNHPAETNWQYLVNGLGDWTQLTTNTLDVSTLNLQLGDHVQVRLVAAENYTFEDDEPIKRDFLVQQLLDTTDFAKQLALKVVHITDENLVLPPAPEYNQDKPETSHSYWEYTVNGTKKGITDKTVPIADLKMKTGDVLGLKLNFASNYASSTGPISRDITVRENIDTTGLHMELKKLVVNIADENLTLPALPDDGQHTFWQYSFDNMDWTRIAGLKLNVKELNLVPGDNLFIGLGLDPNYDSSKGGIKQRFAAQETVPISQEILDYVKTINATHEDGFINFPPPFVDPHNTKWQYTIAGQDPVVINDGSELPKPNELKVGTEITMELIGVPNYVLSTPVKSVFHVTERVSLPKTFRDEFDKTVVSIANGFAGLPAAPKGAVWKFRVNGGESTTQQPDTATLKVGDKVDIELTLQEYWRLEHLEYYKKTFSVEA